MDFPYIFLLFLLLLLAYLEWREKATSQLYFKVACCIVFFFVAFRAPIVGADTWNYYRFATGIRSFYNYDPRDPEPLYLLYNDFFRRFCPIGIVFMSVNTIIIFSPIYYILNKYCKYKAFSVLSFFLLYNYTTYFTALRQVLSLAIILWGVIYVMEKKKYRWVVYLGLGVLAWLMHTTAAVVAPLFIFAYVLRLRNRIIPIAAICITAILGIVLKTFNILDAFNFLLSFNFEATERISFYLQDSELLDNIAINVALRNTILGIIIFLCIDRNKMNHWFAKIYLLGILIFNLFISVPMMQRMVAGNMLFIIVVISWIFESQNYLYRHKQLINIVMSLIILYFTRSYIIVNTDYDIHDEAKMHPYYFYFEDYRNAPSFMLN